MWFCMGVCSMICFADEWEALCCTGTPLVRLYGPDKMVGRGATVSFNLLSARGELIPLDSIQRRADACGISLRTGCMCNPIVGWHFMMASSLRELHGWFPELKTAKATAKLHLDAKVRYTLLACVISAGGERGSSRDVVPVPQCIQCHIRCTCNLHKHMSFGHVCTTLWITLQGLFVIV